MKIMISNATLGRGGAERVISILTNFLVELGHEIEILLFYDKPICYDINPKIKITIDETYIGKTNIVKHILWRRKYIKKTKPDIVVSFLAPFNMVNIISLLGLKIPLVVADRNDPQFIPKKFLFRKMRDFLYRFASGVVLQSERNRNYFKKKIREKSAVIFNPIDVGKYKGSALLEKEGKKIVYVGRLVPQKNPHMLLDAFSKIADKFPDYKLVYYGEGELQNELMVSAKEKKLEDRVLFPGAVKNVFENTKDANIYVMTSDYEGMPNALLEAMCIGLPVISTKVSGAIDVIENEVNGLLIDCRDVEGLMSAMQKMLSNDEFRKVCAQNAVQLSEKLKVETITQSWLDFINQTIKSVRGKE